MDAQGFISNRSTFKNIYSIVIVALSMLFAASLFRSGVRIRNLGAETKKNQDILAGNHRIASLGYLGNGIPDAIEMHRRMVAENAGESLRLIPDGQAPELRKLLQEFRQLDQ